MATWVADAVAGRGRFVALAVGASTLPAYRRLGPLPAGRSVLSLDELVPPPPAGRRFSDRLRDALPPDWTGALRAFDPPAWGAGDFDALGAAVEEELARAGLAAAVCGLGPDGHVAFNQPPDPGTSRCRVVDLTPANLARLGDVAPARAAFTLGTGTLREARRLVVVAAGAGTDDALGRLLDGPAGPDCPATWLRDHPALAVFVVRPTTGRRGFHRRREG